MKARLIESREIAPEIRHFVFEVPEFERLEFQPGQFFSLSHPLGDRVITRAYSVAAPPSGNRFELCLNRVQEGRFSPFLFDLSPGDLVDCKGPYGNFTWRTPVTDSVLIATGTGIAPFRAMLRDRTALDRTPDVILLFGVRHERNLLYREEFEQMARECGNFRFWPTLSRPEPSWPGRVGHVQNHLDEAIAGRTELTFYVCGLKAMVDDVRQMLKGRGFDRKQIVYEKYD